MNLIKILKDNGVEIEFSNNIIKFNINEINKEVNSIMDSKEYHKLSELGFKVRITSKEYLQYAVLFYFEISFKIYLITKLVAYISDKHKEDINILIQ